MNMNDIVLGALFDFMGTLTIGETLTVGAEYESSGILDRFAEWSVMRGIDLGAAGPSRVNDWQDFLAPSGINLVLAERVRQVEEEGWTRENDDRYVSAEMALAAACYAAAAAGHPHVFTRPQVSQQGEGMNAGITIRAHDLWPWEMLWDKRHQHEELRMLAIAGALIAAEIDRRLRVGARNEAVFSSPGCQPPDGTECTEGVTDEG